jgi:serine protease Do
MKKTTLTMTMILIISALVLSACGKAGIQIPGVTAQIPAALAQAEPTAAAPQQVPVAQATGGNSFLAEYQASLENVYEQVGPSVVNIQVTSSQNSSAQQVPNNPFFNSPSPNQQVPQQALGSGFVWDKSGHIVTNNHVVAGADKVEVRFNDGTTVPATVVGTDPDSDLAVIKVDVPADSLKPVTIADSTKVKVGQLAIAIGNPFGLEGTMTVGIVSALGRTLPASESLTSGPVYSIPDIIQTDAPINPGNSGGVLLNSDGQVIGVTAAIESPVQANAGVGFVIPSQIVNMVVPSLIQNGTFQHPWIGISGMNLSPDIATAMGLNANQRGALVEEVMANSPAEKAGLQSGSQSFDLNSQTINIGGDVITAVNGTPVQQMDDLIAYLATNTTVGQKITFTILRNGKEMTIDLTLAARPSSSNALTLPVPQTPQQVPPQQQQPTQPAQPQPQQPQNQGGGYLGVAGVTVDSNIAQQMNLPANQSGVLVVRVDPNSAAEQAGIQAGTLPATINGQLVLLGGDIILGVNNQAVTSIDDLRTILQSYNPGQQVTITILRNGNTSDLTVTLGQRPAQ